VFRQRDAVESLGDEDALLQAPEAPPDAAGEEANDRQAEAFQPQSGVPLGRSRRFPHKEQQAAPGAASDPVPLDVVSAIADLVDGDHARRGFAHDRARTREHGFEQRLELVSQPPLHAVSRAGEHARIITASEGRVMGLTEIWKRFGRHARAPVPDVQLLITPSLVADLLQGRRPAAEARAKPGRWIIRTALPDAAGRARRVVLKVHRRHGLWRRLLPIPGRRRSPGSVECHNLRWAAAQGIPVPVLLSASDFSVPGLGFVSVLATEELTGMPPLDTAIDRAAVVLSPSAFRKWKRNLAAEVARLAQLLHRSHRFHKDLYLSHFFLPELALTDGLPIQGRLRLLDFLRLKRHRWNRRRWQVKDLAQLLYSSTLPGVGVRDRLHFMRAYLGCSKLDQQGRRLIRSVERKAARYRRQNRGRVAR